MRRIFFNGRFMSRAITGVERYGWEMLRAIDALCSEGHDATVGLDFEVIRPNGAIPQHSFTNIRETAVGRYTGHLWEQFELPRYSKDGVLVNFCNLAPLIGKRNVTCIHDANVYLMPANFSWRFRTAYRVLLPLVIRRSQRWITVSHYSAARLAYFRVSDRAPDAIVGDGSEHILRANPNASGLAKANLPRSFVFAMGSRSPNKNIDLILSLASALRAQGISIVLAGGENAAVFKAPNSVNQPLALTLGSRFDNDIA